MKEGQSDPQGRHLSGPQGVAFSPDAMLLLKTFFLEV